MGLEPASVRASVRLFTLLDMNISETSWPIIIKFHLKHHWVGGLAALGFGPDRIRTLISMATGYDGENLVSTLALPFFIGPSLFLQETMTAINAWMGSKFGKNGLGSTELASLERLKKSP